MRPTQFEARMHKAAAAMANPQELYDALGNLLLQNTRNVTPVDTGRLRDSLHVVKGSALSPVIRTEVEYAMFVEFGTRYMPGRHYMERGLDASLEASKQLLQQYGDKVLGKVGGGG